MPDAQSRRHRNSRASTQTLGRRPLSADVLEVGSHEGFGRGAITAGDRHQQRPVHRGRRDERATDGMNSHRFHLDLTTCSVCIRAYSCAMELSYSCSAGLGRAVPPMSVRSANFVATACRDWVGVSPCIVWRVSMGTGVSAPRSVAPATHLASRDAKLNLSRERVRQIVKSSGAQMPRQVRCGVVGCRRMPGWPGPTAPPTSAAWTATAIRWVFRRQASSSKHTEGSPRIALAAAAT
jgi:hypothetical protein